MSDSVDHSSNSRQRMPAFFYLLSMLLLSTYLTGCASSGPKAPALRAQVISEPAGMTILLRGEPVGTAPLELELVGLEEAAELTIANVASGKAVERRIQILGPADIRALLTVSDQPSNLAKSLGLDNILVFDYGERATFKVDSYQLAPSLEPMLKNQAEVLSSRFATLDLFVCGHTDGTGEDDHNRILSVQRAQAVADVLVANGLNSSRLKVQGLAAEYPLAPNTTPEGRTLNRRTEIVIGQ